MGKLLNLIFLFGFLYFVYWMVKRHFRHKKLAEQGYVFEQKGMRPITLFSIVMLVSYSGYMVYFLLADNPS